MEFITDRTLADVEMRTKKGFLNYYDMNRIDGNLKTISDLLGVTYSNKTYNVNSLPRVSDFDRIQSGLSALKEKSGYISILFIPERPYNHFEKINDIEKFEETLYNTHEDNNNSRYYTTEIYSGNDVLI